MSRSTSGDDGRTDPVGASVRQVLAVAVLFAVLGGALVRVATVAAPPAALWSALAVVVVAAGVVLFGGDAVWAALGRSER
ncbi:hypothetical protein [Halobaculum lipolyticum]|uniref:Uncharacterized protein n=1 Tax=Halobaculum lipolyticum TaxID=3032001 RepID=A0ABD5WCL2_9EURY|nr:hypothetical protein [Halobaculum sp. DT31]